MPKSQLQLRKIENRSRRNVTFSKRKNSLLKKAFELNVLCDADVAVLIYSESGKLYQFSDPMMNTILAKYKFCYHYGMDVDTEKMGTHDQDKSENLLSRINLLQKTQKNIMGEDLDSLATKSLDRLEKKLECAKRRVLNRKIKLLYEEIHLLTEEVNTFVTVRNLLELTEVRIKNLEKKTLKAQQTIG